MLEKLRYFLRTIAAKKLYIQIDPFHEKALTVENELLRSFFRERSLDIRAARASNVRNLGASALDRALISTFCECKRLREGHRRQ